VKAADAKSQRLALAVGQTDAMLERSTRFYPKDLPANDYYRVMGWQSTLRRENGVLVEWSQAEFESLPSLARRREAVRAHCEALLVAEALGDAMFSNFDRDYLMRRSLGILPNNESDRFREIWTAVELHPARVVRSATVLLDSLGRIEQQYGTGTAMAYVLFALAGARREEDIVAHADRLDELFERLTTLPAVLPVLEGLEPGLGEGPYASGDLFDTRFGLLAAVHEGIWQLKPRRLGTEFLLTHVVERYLGDAAGAGNSLGLALLDAILLAKLGFRVRYTIEESVMRLVVPIGRQSVHWEVTEHTPLSFVPVASGRELDRAELFALVYGSIGTLCFTRGLFDKAATNFEHVLELRPRAVEAMDSLGSCWLRKGAPDKAVKVLQRALELAPDSGEVHYHLGTAWAMMSDWRRAIDSFRRAIQLRPNYVEAYNNLGFAYMRIGNVQQATAAFEAALESRPDYWEACFNLGNLCLEQQDFAGAVRWYRETVRLQPRLAGAWYNMGQAYYSKGDLDAAVSAYQRAVQIEPKHFGAWHNLGIAYRDKGLTEKAVQALEKAVSINPNLMR
jgi:tetratricopeptide (TPR) repeat protein